MLAFSFTAFADSLSVVLAAFSFTVLAVSDALSLALLALSEAVLLALSLVLFIESETDGLLDCLATPAPIEAQPLSLCC
ncbi:hypothetical protein AB6E88_02470 [Providencia hangzhouensis]